MPGARNSYFFLFLDTAFFLTCLGTLCLRRSALAALTCDGRGVGGCVGGVW